jgi:uracil-DNA glycosylase
LVILGQDPYHNDGQADGLAFSVPKNQKIPPSLRNIFKELMNEFPERGYQFDHGDLTQWFEKEKIFLLNTALTVEKNNPGSHCSQWCQMTDAVIQEIAEKNKKCIFLLLGKHAQEKEKLITNKSRIVKCVHPSPLSASKGFFNSGIFKEVETKLKKEINWQN